MMGRSLLFAAAGSLAVLAAPASAQSDWTQVGSRVVNAAAETDTLFISGEPTHTAIRICAVGRPFALRSATVHFASGATQVIGARTLAAGQCGDAVALTGRDIDRIVVAYARYGPGETAARVRIDAR